MGLAERRGAKPTLDMPSLESNATAGTLYIVGTPIGNLADMTFRAVQTLREVDLIAAEDTRHSGRLLQHFQIATPQISYHQHNTRQRLPELMTRLQQGAAIALISDAGMPTISDPGSELVRACLDAGIAVVPIPGVTAAIAALAASGLPSDRFVFEGFLPAKPKLRQARLATLARESRTVILYEAPHRLPATLRELAAEFGSDRSVVLARELTKLHEEVLRLTFEAAIAYYAADPPPKGEFTLVIAGRGEEAAAELSEAELRAELQALMQQGKSRSQASRELAALTSRSRRELYQLADDEL